MKVYSEYPEQYRQAVLRAAAGPYSVTFEHSKAAYSFRMRVWWMQQAIAAQQDAPADLREACQRVRWTGPKLTQYGTWQLVGTTESKPGLSDADVIAAIREKRDE